MAYRLAMPATPGLDGDGDGLNQLSRISGIHRSQVLLTQMVTDKMTMSSWRIVPRRLMRQVTTSKTRQPPTATDTTTSGDTTSGNDTSTNDSTTGSDGGNNVASTGDSSGTDNTTDSGDTSTSSDSNSTDETDTNSTDDKWNDDSANRRLPMMEPNTTTRALIQQIRLRLGTIPLLPALEQILLQIQIAPPRILIPIPPVKTAHRKPFLNR